MYCNLEHKQMVENRGYIYIGSYDRKEMTKDGKNKNKNKIHIRVKCPYCKTEYDIDVYTFRNGSHCKYCCHEYKKSFAYYIEEELGLDLNDVWDWEENSRRGINPWDILIKSDKIIYIWCQDKWYHGSYKTEPRLFYSGNRCGYCGNHKVHPKDSFGQWAIDNIDEDFMIKYWSNKNTVNPWEISQQSNKKVWILCQDKDYHNDEGGYPIALNNFYNGKRCGYCASQKVHPKDSFGALYPSKAKYWSSNNEKSPYEVLPMCNDEHKFICEKCGEEFERKLFVMTKSNTGVVCKDCQASQLEEKCKTILQKHNIIHIREVIFNDLLGLGNGNLSYDFYLPDYNLLIECQGIQHKEWQKTWMSKEKFERQLEHDRRKKQYAIDHNINFLEIWYYDVDNIEEILIKQLNLI